MALEKELDTYHRKLPELLDDEGKFVLISGDLVHGVYDTYEDALTIGYQTFGLKQPFLVKRIAKIEPILFFTRHIVPSPCHL